MNANGWCGSATSRPSWLSTSHQKPFLGLLQRLLCTGEMICHAHLQKCRPTLQIASSCQIDTPGKCATYVQRPGHCGFAFWENVPTYSASVESAAVLSFSATSCQTAQIRKATEVEGTEWFCRSTFVDRIEQNSFGGTGLWHQRRPWWLVNGVFETSTTWKVCRGPKAPPHVQTAWVVQPK